MNATLKWPGYASMLGSPTLQTGAGWKGQIPSRIKRLIPFAGLVIVRVSGALLAGALAVLVARVYGPGGSGQFYLAVTALTVMSVLTRLGAESYITSRVDSWGRQGPRAPAEDLAATLGAMTLLVVAACSLLGIIGALWPDMTHRLLAGLPLWGVALGVMGLNTSWVATGYYRARGRAGLSIFLETGLLSLWLLAIVLISRATTDTLPDKTTVALALALIGPAILIALAPVLRRSGRALVSPHRIKASLLGLVAFGSVTITNGIIVLIPLQALGWYGMSHEAGVYNAALRVSMFVGAFGVVVKSLIVRQAAHEGASLDTNRGREVRLAALFCLPWLVMASLISWQGSHLVQLFGEGFDELQGIIFLMLVAQSVNVAAFPIETRAVLANERRLLNITSVLAFVTALFSSLILIDHHGLAGAAWAFTLTILVSRGLLTVLYVSRVFSHRDMAAPRTPPSSQELR